MKDSNIQKSVLAIALLAAGASASAQSSVTLFGIVDATLEWGHGSTANRFQMTNSGYNTSRLGFRGVEDLGGGLAASFWLEMGMNNDDGTGQASNLNNQASGAAAAPAGTQGLTFNRRSTVSLSGTWGELRLGRDYTPQFWNRSGFDPFTANGVGTVIAHNLSITGVTAVRASNSIGYLLPATLGGLYGQVQYYAGENPSNAGATHHDGTGYGARLGYQAGPLNVAGAVSYTHYAAGGVHQNNAGVSWDFRVVKLMAQYEADANGAVDAHGWLLGGVAPVGPGEIRASYSRYTIDRAPGVDPRTSKWAVGYVHNLSKRTAVYANYAHVTNSNGASYALGGAVTAVNGSSSGLDLGIRHSF